MQRRSRHSGMTILEMMIVLAILALLLVLARTGFRVLTKADLVEDATELSAIMRRASQLAIEHGELHRVRIDLDKHAYIVEICQGATAIQRNEVIKRADDEDTRRAIERGKDRLRLNMGSDSFAGGDAEEATKRAIAVAGQHIQDRSCVPATDTFTGDAEGKGWARQLRVGKGVKFKRIYVAHRDGSIDKGDVAVYFFPNGASEKAVVEMTDGSEVFTVLVYGLTGRVELRDGELANIDDHMLKNVMGDRDAKREDTK
jgi:prepilin-type N-terminal cleavage/methylation domain-containing protein